MIRYNKYWNIVFQLLVGEIQSSQNRHSCLIFCLIESSIYYFQGIEIHISLKLQKYVNARDHRNRVNIQIIQFLFFSLSQNMWFRVKSLELLITQAIMQQKIYLQWACFVKSQNSLSCSSHNLGTDHPILRNHMQPIIVFTWTNIATCNFIIQ